MSNLQKPIVLIFIGNYLPGFKAGGIIRSVENTINHLHEEFDFRIVTRDRDLGDKEPYADIKTNQWQQVGNASVYYLHSSSETFEHIGQLLSNTPHNVLYLNSFFDALSIKALINKKLRKANSATVVLTPRGEFAWASLSQKYIKKYIYILLSRMIGLYREVIWHASSEFEAKDIMDVMKVDASLVRIAFDLPTKQHKGSTFGQDSRCLQGKEQLRVVFLSRISPEKNLDYALKVLSKVTANIKFDIYGTIENKAYWEDCQQLISALPNNISVEYGGSVKHDDVIETLGKYDLFLFPSGGEAYGHVIAESLIAGTQALISTNTPWRDLAQKELGWDIDLRDDKSFVAVIESLALSSDADFANSRALIKSKIDDILLNPDVMTANRVLFSPK